MNISTEEVFRVLMREGRNAYENLVGNLMKSNYLEQ
jgi:hypothetical protein